MADDSLQFDRAEPVQDQPNEAQCSVCKRVIESSYYSAKDQTFCLDCKARIERELSSSRGSLARGVLLGAGAAVLGTALYFGVAAITGYEIGLIAIAVGWLVGRAMQLGSKGTGGRRYQIAAVALTYLSIAASYTGLAIKQGADENSVVLALALPIIVVVSDLPGGLLSALIIGFGLFQAWQMNRRVEVEFLGPFQIRRPGPPATAAAG